MRQRPHDGFQTVVRLDRTTRWLSRLCIAARSWMLFLLIALSSSYVHGQESETDRLWKDASGKFEVTAKFVRIDGESVTLRSPEGKTLSIKISQLSAEDQKYLQGRVPDQVNDQKSSFEIQSSASAPNPRMVFHTGRKLELDGPEIWNVQPNPAPQWTMAVGDLELPGDYSRQISLVQAPSSPHAILVAAGHLSCRAQLIDCSKVEGVASEAFELPDAVPICLSPDGRRLLMANGRIGFDPSDLAVFDLQDSSAKMRIRWTAFKRPMEFQWDGFEGVRAATFIDSRNLLTFHRGLIALWDVERGELKWWTYRDRSADGGVFERATSFVVSPGGKHLFFVESGFLIVISLPDGKLIAKKAFDYPPNSLSISPDGTQLVVLTAVLKSVDLTSGETQFTLGTGQIRGSAAHQSIAMRWVDNQNLILDDEWAMAWIDLDRKRELALMERNVGFSRGRVDLLLDGQGGVLYVARNDEFDAKSNDKLGLFRLKRDALLALAGPNAAQDKCDLQPGDAVNVDLHVRHKNLDGSQSDLSADMQPIVEDLLRKSGFVVQPGVSNTVRLEWNLEVKIVERETQLGRTNSAPNPDDKMRPQTGTARSVSDLDDQSNKKLDLPKMVTSTIDWTEHNCGIYVNGTNVHGLMRHHVPSVFELPLPDLIQWTIRRMEIPNFVSAYRGNLVTLDFAKIRERPDSNPLSNKEAFQPNPAR